MSLPDPNTYANMGGELVDYQAAEDPTTDLPADADNENRSDCAAMTRTAVRAYCSFTYNSGVSIVDHNAVWGNGVSVVPTVVRLSGGEYQITWPATVTDARGTVHSVNLRHGWANVEWSGTDGLFAAQVRVTAPNVAVVTTNSSGSLADPTDAICAFVI